MHFLAATMNPLKHQDHMTSTVTVLSWVKALEQLF
jgi:hypothetical protein